MNKAQRQQRLEQVRHLFGEVAELPAAEQLAALKTHTNDEALINEVLSLLRNATHAESDEDPFEQRIGNALAGLAADVIDNPVPLKRVGAYRIIREIGRGGMGVVYEAEQDNPARRVALKVVATGLASPSLIERFQREAQVLGRLDHPGIARILEAGTFDAGAGPVPFFAMDLIDGQSITDAVEAMSLKERLSLLANVADAVHHAHLRGVIHRDLKPANVLIDRRGDARVVDFGIARLLDPDDQGVAAPTVAGDMLGTPTYMSPEQALGDPAGIDARSDIHALGVLSYEVLTGSTPLDVDGLSLDEQLRDVRHTAPRRLGPKDGIPKDVGVVLAMALEKDPDRRHDSAAAFAEDLRNARDGRPVAGRAPSVMYQLNRIAARHPLGTGLTVGALALLIASTIAISLLLGRSIEAERRAASEARIARSVTTFLVDDVFGSVSPNNRASERITVDEMVDQAAADALVRFEEEPDVAKEILRALAEVDLSLGRYAQAQRRVDDIDSLPVSSTPPATNDGAAIERAEALRLVRGGLAVAFDDPDQGLAIYQGVLAQRQARLGADHPDVLAIAHATAKYQTLKDLDSGLAALDRSLADHERVFGADDLRTINVVDDIALQYVNAGRHEEALPFAQRVARSFPAIEGDDGWRTLHSLVILGEIHRSLNDFDAAMSAFERAMAGFERRGTPQTSYHRISLEANIGLLHMNTGDFASAEPFLDRAIANGTQAGEVGTAPFETIRHNYGALKMLLERHDEADTILSDVYKNRVAIMGVDHFETLITRGLQGENRRRGGNLEESIVPLTEAWEGLAEMFGEDGDFATRTADRLVQVYTELGNDDQIALWQSRSGSTE
ncbi:MAG: serine/threonine-protein kinase [Pseudomonadota bacterium]